VICGATFERLSTGELVACVLPEGHACAHHWETLTTLSGKPMKYAAARNRRKARARKEGPMSPTVNQSTLHLPPGWRLAQRQGPPRSDERPILRDREGRTLAVVERWLPDHDAVN
jgi:hypothetical protein